MSIETYNKIVYVPIYKHTIPELPLESEKLNLEFYNIYNLLTSLVNGGIRYNTYKILYNENLDSLDIYYKDNVKARLDNTTNLSIAGTLYENQEL